MEDQENYYSYSVDQGYRVTRAELLKRENEVKEAGLDLEKIIDNIDRIMPGNIKEKVEYITQELGIDKKVFEKFPALFGYSMSKRIWPRLELIREQGFGFSSNMLSLAEDGFLHHYNFEKYQLDSKIDQFENSVYAKKL